MKKVKILFWDFGEITDKLKKQQIVLETRAETIEELLDDIEKVITPFKTLILRSNQKLKSCVDIYKNPLEEKYNGKIKEPLKENVIDGDTIVFSIFDPPNVKNKIDASIKQRKDAGDNSFDILTQESEEEQYEFFDGEEITNIKGEDILDEKKNKLLYPPLADALIKMKWKRLRLFQEDVLRYSLSIENTKEPILVSMPTGGGKTESFLIPLFNIIIGEKLIKNAPVGVKGIIFYPTKALSNDQADRIMGYLYYLNKELESIGQNPITIGILTGDSSSSEEDIEQKSLQTEMQTCPKCGKTTIFYNKDKSLEGSILTCRECDATINYVKCTRKEIFENPPDILITNPDKINYTLLKPNERKILTDLLKIVIFDELHQYTGIFGTNVAYLLRRIESAINKKPIYMGFSATVGNATELASLLFNEEKDKINYINYEDEDVSKKYIDKSKQYSKKRYHYAIQPVNSNYGPQYTTATYPIQLAIMLGHLTKDIHKRKGIFFGEFVKNADKMTRLMKAEEEKYWGSALEYGQNPTGNSKEEIKKKFAWVPENIDKINKNKLEIGWHRGGLQPEERINFIRRFKSDQPISIIGEPNPFLPVDYVVSTTTLELGLDIGDVSSIFNAPSPLSISSYKQRVGRAGRVKDSMVFTILPEETPLANYYFKKFKETFGNPKAKSESVPLVITNEFIFEASIRAFVIDFLSKLVLSYKISKGTNLSEINAYDFNSDALKKYQSKLDELISDIYDYIFPSKIKGWLDKEEGKSSKISEKLVGEDNIKEIIKDTLKKLFDEANKQRYNINSTLISGRNGEGFGNKFVINLRSSGSVATVELPNGKKENVSVSKAIKEYPWDSSYDQGPYSYKVLDINGDVPKSNEIVFRLMNKEHIIKYFHNQISQRNKEDTFNFPSSKDELMKLVSNRGIEIIVPKTIKVEHYPKAFICSKCGRVYGSSEKTYKDLLKKDFRCMYYACNSELSQVTDVYFCKGCGAISDPIIPKNGCFNPRCSGHLSGKKPYEVFRFNELGFLRWQCRLCKNEVDFIHPLNINKVPEQFKKKVGMISNVVHGICPQGNHKTDHKSGLTVAKEPPKISSDIIEYTELTESYEEKENNLSKRVYGKFDVYNIAAGCSFTWYKSKDEGEIPEVRRRSFGQNRILADWYPTYGTEIVFNRKIIDDFIDKISANCINCTDCKKNDNNKASFWTKDEYMKISDNKKKLLYVLMHTLKHAISNAAPKYTGVNRFDIHPILDWENYKIKFLDPVEGGTGAMKLFFREWENIINLAEDLTSVNEQLFLTIGCKRFDKDLCVNLLRDFFKYLKENKTD